MEMKRGDIFYIYRIGGDNVGSEMEAGRPAVIVSNDLGNEYAPVLEIVYLTTQPKKPQKTHVEIMCRTLSTAICEQVHTVSKERVGDYIRSCTEEEMAAIDKALLISLGIECKQDAITEIHLTTNTPQEMTGNKVAELMERNKLETERNMYKQLYDDLMSRLVFGRNAG